MKAPHKDNMLWPVIRLAVMLLALYGCLTFGYSSGFDEYKDARTMLIVALFAGAMEAVKRLVAK